jgi:tetratricopeptide (TPR) repeat protein
LLKKFFFPKASRKKIYNGIHPEVADTLYNIAINYSDLGKYEKALETLQEVLGN